MLVHLLFMVYLEILVAFQGWSVRYCRSGKGNPYAGMPFIHAHPPDGNQTGSFRVILRRHTEDYWPAVRQMPVTNQFADRFAGPVHDFLTEKILYVHDHTHKLTLRTVYPQNK